MTRITLFTFLIVVCNITNAQTFNDQASFEDALASGTLVDTSQFLGQTTLSINSVISDAQFFGPDALVRSDDFILNGSGFHGIATPHVGINFLTPIDAVGISSNPIDGGTILLYSGPNGTGALLSSVGFGGEQSVSFTGIITASTVASVVFTCEFNQDLKCGLRDPVFGLSLGNMDSDSDGVSDLIDNCLLSFNPSQADTDNDQHGNACDPDFDNSCIVNFLDVGEFANNFLSSNLLYDLNDDGQVNFLDYSTVVAFIFQSPGPSASGDCNDN